ncbi:hypothetical protein BDV96DRAFT_564131 [Lophiotrema nucula]|uniref:Signal peptide-containing protein n=1 Tax=Lophiotrema nucula TaxID=690887 RepID=A0A6A5ZQE5_9PLEO|nr:hypothetical protein BDV96DRAFT_564131 [Lophiotrema nucula]
MSWFMRGVQSAVFHYASCTPCTGYMDRKQRAKRAKKERKAKQKLQLEQPDLYHHPEPSGTNPYWSEEIVMGPGPPPRRARRTNTGNTGKSSQRAITTAGTQSTGVSSIDVGQGGDPTRMSEDTLDDDNWNRKRYQREDEDLWGFGEFASPTQPMSEGSSIGIGGVLPRPGTSKSSAETYYTARNPPVNDLHPPVVSLPSPHPSDNRWMLQPPPKASVMSGKERATNRSRSGSGASSRVELSLARQVSARQLKSKLERGETPEMPSISRGSSYSNLHSTVAGQRHDRPRTPQARPVSAASSRKKKRRDTAFTSTVEVHQSSGDGDSSSDTPIRRVSVRRTPTPPQVASVPSDKIVRVRNSRQRLSTVLSSGSGGDLSPPHPIFGPALENDLPKAPSPAARPTKYSSTQSSDSLPYVLKPRAPLFSSDVSSLNALQDIVSSRTLLNSRIVSSPLMEAKIRLPPSSPEEQRILEPKRGTVWTGNGFGISREWGTDQVDGQAKAPFDSPGIPERDPKMRWSVDF